MNINIPKIYHQTWKTKDIPNEKFKKEWTDSFQKYHKDWLYMFHTDEDNEVLVNKFPELLHIYKQLKGIEKIDFVRCLYMYEYGGMYGDLDIEWCKNIEDLLTHQKIYFYLNCILISPPKHQFWIDFLKGIQLNLQKRLLAKTGPIAIKRCAKQRTDTIELSYKHFGTIGWNSKNKNATIDKLKAKETYAVHRYSNSWK
tara:strand:- start:1025 stop:1621 length:597 start_codon:yes stop_codon:yes gene_type:complete